MRVSRLPAAICRALAKPRPRTPLPVRRDRYRGRFRRSSSEARNPPGGEPIRVQRRGSASCAAASSHRSAASRAPSGGVVPAGGCGCGGDGRGGCSCEGGASSQGDCGCGGDGKGGCSCEGDAKASYVYAIGTIGVDFGTEARRDTFRQLMPRYPIGEGESQITVPPNPYDVTQLASYLDVNKSESGKLIWTLNLDLTPIYAIEAELAYADEVYSVLRDALKNQALLPTTTTSSRGSPFLGA